MSETNDHPLAGTMVNGELDHDAVQDAPETQPDDRQEAGFGKRAEKRIAKLLSRSKYAEDRASRYETENETLRRQLIETQKYRASAEAVATTGNVAQAERDLKQAKIDGDIDAEVTAQSKLSEAQARSHEARQIKAQAEIAADAQVTSATPAMRAWLDDNRVWFETDASMKGAAMSFHTDAVRRGIVPETAGYFAHIDKKMRGAYPDYFDDDADDGREDEVTDPEPTTERKAPAVVAGAAPRRNGGPGAAQLSAGKIKISPSDLEGARIAGVTPQAYIAAKVARQKRGN